MAILATNTGGSTIQPIEAGSYPARCYSMIHIGTIDENFQGEIKTMNKVRITFELPTELKVFKEENGEQPNVISKEFTLSLHEKATLRSFLKNWRGQDFTDEEAKSFDIERLIGAPCMLNITHKKSKDGTKTYAEIGSVSKLPKGLECPAQINPSYVWTYENFDQEKFNKIPEFLRQKMVTSFEYIHATTVANETQVYDAEVVSSEPQDDLPF
jgi:hypothetical protein